MRLKIYSVPYSIRRLSWLRGHSQWLRYIILISKSVPVVYFVIWFKDGTGKELGDCKCGAQTPESSDVDECVCVGVDTEYHHHVLSGGGLWLCLWLCLWCLVGLTK